MHLNLADNAAIEVTTLYTPERAQELYGALVGEVSWAQYHVTVRGTTYPQPRLTAWMGPGPYRYAGVTLPAAPLSATVADIAADVAVVVGEPFDAVLANWYRSGDDAMGYHADNESELGPEPLVASVSFGATRTMRFRPRDGGASVGVALHAGELLVMPRGLQATHHHAVVRTRRAVGGRVNLTFRQYCFQGRHLGPGHGLRAAGGDRTLTSEDTRV